MSNEENVPHVWADNITWKKKKYYDDNGNERTKRENRRIKRNNRGVKRMANKANKTYRLGNKIVDRKVYRAAKRKYRKFLYRQHRMTKYGGKARGNKRITYTFEVEDVMNNPKLQKPYYCLPGTQIFKFTIKRPLRKVLGKEEYKRQIAWWKEWKQDKKDYLSEYTRTGKPRIKLPEILPEIPASANDFNDLLDVSNVDPIPIALPQIPEGNPFEEGSDPD